MQLKIDAARGGNFSVDVGFRASMRWIKRTMAAIAAGAGDKPPEQRRIDPQQGSSRDLYAPGAIECP